MSRALQVGDHFRIDAGWPQKPSGGPLAEWVALRVTPGAAYAREAYRTPKRVEIKDYLGNVVRSFLASEGGKVESLARYAMVERVEA